jgi:D-alanine-D-alanine ligase
VADSVPAKPRVAVVFGGRSTEHGISCVSAGQRAGRLDPDEFDVVPIGITRDGGWVLTTGDSGDLRIQDRPVTRCNRRVRAPRSFSHRIRRSVPSRSSTPADGVRALSGVDVVLPVLHGAYGEDGTIQGLLEMAGCRTSAPACSPRRPPWTRSSPRSCGRRGHPGRPVRGAARRPVAVAADRTASACRCSSSRPGPARRIGITRSPTGPTSTPRSPPPAASTRRCWSRPRSSGREIECGVLEGEHGGAPEASCSAEIRCHRATTSTTSRPSTSTTSAVRHPGRPAAEVSERVRELAGARSPRSTAPAWPGSTSS